MKPLMILVVMALIVFAVYLLPLTPQPVGNNLSSPPPAASPVVVFQTGQGNVTVSVEIADTQQEWERGLMGRTALPENSGMIFVFPQDRPQTFWMKDTLIPLDIVFVSSSLEIVDIKQQFQPCQHDPCETYTARDAARYVIEVNGGFASRHRAATGDHMFLKLA